ncbi:MAG: pyridoxal-phosphate dependent enzyme [Crocinitomicaceae bacterium]|nr:pyridoxal-phosphate dependent enzyme [Crocinitomicaceae bacterium]
MDLKRSILQEINSESFEKRGISLYIKRDDLIDPEISGNKWRKLKYNIALCESKMKDGILTFGGAYSNHLVATAAACKNANLGSVGFVRGDELNAESNATLKRCAELGMELNFIPREEYAMRNDKEYHETLGADYPSLQLVPEGGANYYGMIGCQEMLSEIDIEFDHIFLAQGTTTTSCGIVFGVGANQKVHAVPVLKGFSSMEEMKALFSKTGIDQETISDLLERIVIHPDSHFGGYAKYTPELIEFIRDFYQQHEVKLDPIYTGKAMFELMKQLESSEFDNSKILFIHTGGLQGIPGVEKKMGEKLFQ